ncbi:MAG: hypothetical protein ACU841_11215 [Gammaproteobacteria bacterium]
MLDARTLFLAFFLLILPLAGQASDHADPIDLDPDTQEPNITGLFFYPEGDNMIVAFNVRRSLTAAPPYDFDPYEFTVHMDLHSKINFDNPEDKARYGGTIVNPDGIEADAKITLHLNNDATLKDKTVAGLKNPENIKFYTGVRDDPFIFPRFFDVNVVTMVMSIPRSSFPENQKNWLLWGTSKDVESGEQIDHVGRSNRTQLGRFDILNTVHPSKHVALIKQKTESRKKLQDFFLACIPPLAQLNQLSGLLFRHYDYVPDVMIYTTQYAPGFPNGRRLTDDVALLTCNQGDCPLQENAFIDTTQWPRSTVNDKPFMDAFPYLAEPWPARPQTPAPSCWPYILKYALIPGLIILALIAGLSVWLHRRCCHRDQHG